MAVGKFKLICGDMRWFAVIRLTGPTSNAYTAAATVYSRVTHISDINPIMKSQ